MAAYSRVGHAPKEAGAHRSQATPVHPISGHWHNCHVVSGGADCLADDVRWWCVALIFGGVPRDVFHFGAPFILSALDQRGDVTLVLSSF